MLGFKLKCFADYSLKTFEIDATTFAFYITIESGCSVAKSGHTEKCTNKITKGYGEMEVEVKKINCMNQHSK